METIDIEQVLFKTGDARYEVEIAVNGEDSEVYKFTKTNAVYPLFQTLISKIREYNNVTVNLITNEPNFAREINGIPNHNTLLGILKNVQERNGIIIRVNNAE